MNLQGSGRPDAWWKGKALVAIRVANSKLYIKLTNGNELRSTLIGKTPITKLS